jgi:peptide/nickel transport system substrate-binding protein
VATRTGNTPGAQNRLLNTPPLTRPSQGKINEFLRHDFTYSRRWREAKRRAAAVAAGTLACLVLSWGLEPQGFGQDGGETVPSSLLRSIPFDRVTLIDGTVLIVDPVSPRPLPAYDATKEKKAFSPPREGNVLTPAQKSKAQAAEEKAKEQEQYKEVPLHVLQGEVRDFKVKRTAIKQIDYFEDLLLAEGDRWRIARDYARAFECYLRVETRYPGWAGLDEHVNRLLFEEGSAALLDGDGERGLRLLRELFTRKPAYSGLADKLAAAYGSRAQHAFELGLYAKGRRILHELEPLAPNHPILKEVRDRFVAKARTLADGASRQSGARRTESLAEALRVWPTLEGADAKFSQAFAADPILGVAVTDVPRPIGPWIRSAADARVSRLLFLPILARDDENAVRGKSPGQLAARLDSTDLGRRLTLRLKRDFSWSDASRPVSAIDVARAFTDRTVPSSPQYNARWADLLDRVEVIDESRVDLRLTRAFLKPAFWLVAPVGPAHAGWDGRVVTSGGERVLVSDGPYSLESATADRVHLRKAAAPGIRHLVEHRHMSAKAAMGALVRGEVSLMEHVPPDRVAGLAAMPDIKVGRFSRPSLHWIAVDGRNPVLRNRALRRGLSYAIDRKALLEETLLKHPSDAVNTVSDGPVIKGSHADSLGVEPLGYDPLLAKMLVAAARKELGGGPIKLTIEYPAVPEPQAVIPRIVEALRLVGVEITATERPWSEFESELRAGRRFDLAYRMWRGEEPILEAGGILCPGYDAPTETDAIASLASPRILQLLLQLERAPEFPSAKGLVLQIDRESRDELPILPLWQLEDHYAWRTRLKGPADETETLYQGVETWEIEPWFAHDSW